MAKFEKGTSGNPSGRPPGSKNKTSQQAKRILSQVLSDELEGLPDLLRSLEADKRADVIVKLCKYVLPPISSRPPSFGDPDPFEIDLP